ncbi:hypothetical protein [Scytonema sp. NUACC26]|uniref:hypothetical protein n=1 Tax=Scytonema sp. NUACC26 TaxID=3140176 RepID=UPI0038B2A55C
MLKEGDPPSATGEPEGVTQNAYSVLSHGGVSKSNCSDSLWITPVHVLFSVSCNIISKLQASFMPL